MSLPRAAGIGRRTAPPAAGTAVAAFVAPARAATAGSLGAVALTIAVQVLVPGGWGSAAWVPLVAGLLIGVPHGAVDHLVPSYRLGGGLSRSAAFALGYAAVAAAAYLAFTAVPGPALVGFVLLSAWYVGSGETAFADLRARRPVTRRVPASVVLGATVLVLPLVRGSAEARQVVAAVVPGSDGMVAAQLAIAVELALPLAALLLTGTLAARGRWLDAVEVVGLLVLALVVPPLAAFGVYFGCWHSLRHLARVVAEDPGNAADLDAGRLVRPLRRCSVAAALPTAAVLVVLGILWSAADGWRGFVATDLPLLAALTVPHVLVVSWLDRAAGGVRTGVA